MKNVLFPLSLSLLSVLSLQAATDLRQTSVKEVVNDVKIIAASSQTATPAHVNDQFKAPDLIRTGVNSRAELVAPDQTVARVGANTMFSFDPVGRKINLTQGSVLFHAPQGKGGGVIQTAAATAAVTGTTIIVTSTKNGGFKVLVLEGKARVQLPNGKRLDLIAGQLSFIMPGSQNLSQAINFNLGTLVKGSRLVNGYQASLSSRNKIEREIKQQTKLTTSQTSFAIGDAVGPDDFQLIDTNTLQAAVSDGDHPIVRFLLALKTDATIGSSNLDNRRIFTNSQVPNGKSFFLQSLHPNPNDDNNNNSAAFIAQNLTISTSSIDLPSLNREAFVFAAKGTLNIQGSLDITGDYDVVDFHSDNKMTIAPGSQIYFSGKEVTFEAGPTIKLVNVSLKAGQYIFMESLRGDLDLLNGNLNAPFIQLVALDSLKMVGTTFINTQSINLDSRTSFFINVNFPNVPVNIGVQTGNYNVLMVLGPPTPGHANFFNSAYNGTPLPIGMGSGNIPGTQINVFPNGF